MKNIRLFHPDPISIDQNISLTNSALQHALVLKVKTGQPLTLFNGQGGEYHGRVEAIGHKSCIVRIENFVEHNVESPLQIHLVQGISRGQKMDYTIQKSVELGVSSILPVLCHRSVVKLDQEKAARKQQHWQAVAVSACEQCGRNTIPTIHMPQELSAWAHQTTPLGKGIVLLPGAGERLAQVDKLSEYTVVIGPEGGFEPHEEEWLVNNRYHAVSLGPRILRTETAAVAAISALGVLHGDL